MPLITSDFIALTILDMQKIRTKNYAASKITTPSIRKLH